MPQAHLQDVEIAYQQMGDGADLVFVHGLAANRAFWFAQYAVPLSQRYRVTLFDLRGHGYSSRPASGYDAATMAEDLRALLDHLGIRRCGLIGHSYGGGIAMEFAGRYPDQITHLAILDSRLNCVQPEMRLSDSPYLSPFEAEIARRSGHDWGNEAQVGLCFLEELAHRKISGTDAEIRDAFTPFGEGRGAKRTARQLIDVLELTTARQDFLVTGIDVAAIAALRMPMLLMYGDASRCLPTYRAMESILPQAEREMVANGGHFFPQSHGALTLARLERFLEKPAALPHEF